MEPRTRTATVLFSDLVGSTELLAHLGEATFDGLRRAHFAVLRRSIDVHHGTEIKTLGDGFLAVFGSAADALRAAVAMQQGVDRHARRESRPIAIRVGLALGDLVFEEDDVFGGPVVEAARLVARAAPGQILATVIVPLVAGGRSVVPVTELEPVMLKGFPDPVRICAVSWDPVAEVGIPLPAVLGEVNRVFAGRDTELALLDRLWSELSDGRARAALVGGEPGVGKTRLSAEFADSVHARGGLVLAGRCAEDLSVPYQPFVESLAHFVAHTADHELVDRLGRYPGELARLIPELAARIPSLPTPVQADPETERYRLFDAVAAWLHTIAADGSVLLVLDDLQWATKPTLLMLRHLLQPPGPGPVLVLATYRDTDLSHDHPLVALMADLRRRDGVERCALTGVEEAAVAEIMTLAAGEALGEDGLRLARAIHSETEGNPFFVQEVIRHLIESGAIERQAGRWALTRPISEVGIPEGVREVVGRRLSRLSAAANHALEVAAVLGPDFDVAVLQAAAEIAAPTAIETLEAAESARLVVEVAGQRSHYRFSHALIRETLYERLSSARRVSIHRRAAESIEAIHAGRLDEHLPALAQHWTQAATPGPDASKALMYLAQAGRQAVGQLAHDEAARYFRQGLEVLDAFGDRADHGRRIAMLIDLGEAQRQAGDASYREVLLEASRLADAHGDAAAMARAVLANSRGFTWNRSGGVDTARVEQLEAALTAVGPQDHAVRARLLAALAMELIHADAPAHRRRLSDEALVIARRLDDPAVLSAVLLTRFVSLWHPSTLAERRANTAEALEVAARLDDPLTMAWASYRASIAAMEAGDAEDGERLRLQFEHLVLTEELVPPSLQWIGDLNHTMTALLHGDVDGTEHMALRGLELGLAVGQDDAQLWFEVHLFNIRYDQGRLGEIKDRFAAIAGQYPAMPVLQAFLALLHTETGDLDAARGLLDRLAAQDFADIAQDVLWLGALLAAAVVAHRVVDRPRCEILYAALLPYPDHISSPPHFPLGPVSHYLGLLAGTLGRIDDAEAHLAEAEKAATGMSAPTWVARIRVAQDALRH